MQTNLIFDMDGTLWDSASNVARSWTHIIARHPNPDRTMTTFSFQKQTHPCADRS